jgi:type IV secretion system protein VirD4
LNTPNFQIENFVTKIEQLQLLQIVVISIIVLLVKWLVEQLIRHKRKSKPIQNLHGSARFSSFEEIQNNNILNNADGVFIGAIEHKNEWHFLKHHGAEHCLALAPTRSGKGICLVVPTLLTWKKSAIIIDIKRELWHLTHNWRKTIGDCYLFDPSSPESACFNPMQEVRIHTPQQIADAQNIAIMLVDDQGKGLEAHWDKTAYELLTGIILYLLHKNNDAALADIMLFFADDANSQKSMLRLSEFECEDKVAQLEINNVGKSMFAKPEKELGSIISTAIACLSVFRDPLVQNATKTSTFSIHDLMNKTKPVSLYIASDPSNMDRLRPLIRLIMNQILRKLTEAMTVESSQSISPHKHQLLLMLDEFTSLGYMEIFQKSLAFMASYGIKGYFIAQDISQIHQYYGKYESITANCNIQIAFTPNKLETAQYLSNLMGNKTEYKKSISLSGKSKKIHNDNYSMHIQEIKRPLMTPEEIMTMKGLKKQHNQVIETGNMLIFINGFKPILGKQAPYFLNTQLMRRIERK